MLTKTVHDLSVYVGRAQKLMARLLRSSQWRHVPMLMSLITCIQCIHFVVVVDNIADLCQIACHWMHSCNRCAPLCALARSQTMEYPLQLCRSKLVTSFTDLLVALPLNWSCSRFPGQSRALLCKQPAGRGV